MNDSTEKILAGLNPEQREAVSHGEGPLMIIAGAGTGKTRVITYRIAYLIAAKEAFPREILALTFTEKAASEMAERVDELVPYGFADMWISTFHSFGDRLLRDYALELGLSPDFRVLTRPEQNIFLREHLFEFPLDYYRPLSNPIRFIDSILTLFSRAKDENVTTEEYSAYARELQRLAQQEPSQADLIEMATQQLELAETYQKYQELMKLHNNVDFGDQIVLTLELFRKHPLILKKVQSRYRYILVDEFQDTNFAQFQLVQMLAGKNGNITVVCDDDQSIYKFRGAAISNILRFRDIFPNAKQVVLTRNYRSTQQVLDASYNLICHNNPDRLEVRDNIKKRLIALTTDGPLVQHLHFHSLSAESDAVAQIIEEKVKAQQYRYQDFAILVRANNDADPFLRSLNMRSIPFQFSGSRGLYLQPEVRLLISFLRALTDLKDSVSLYHLASSEIYNVPMLDLTACLNIAHRANRSLHDILNHLDEFPELSNLTAESRQIIQKMISELHSYLELSRNQPAGVVLYQFMMNSGFLKNLTNAGTPESEVEILNIAKFFNVVRHYSEIGVNDNVHTFTKHLDLLIDAGDDPATAESELDINVVNVLTVHKSKGLEFPVVFMVSLVQNKFPSMNRKEGIPLPDELIKDEIPKEDFHIQEERRLFYVGMTRAEKELYLTSARDYGGSRVKKVSQFILEALDKPKADEEFVKTSAIESIYQFAPVPDVDLEPAEPISDDELISLSYQQIETYDSCPLQYKYRHVLHVPILPHHSAIYGNAIHIAVQEYNRRKALDQSITLEEILQIFRNQWLNRGFLSREHEEQRLQAGIEVLTRFYQTEEQNGSKPVIVEQQFSFIIEDYNRITGRWDRIDMVQDAVKIIDFKSTDVREQEKADKKAKESLQLGIYALAYQEAFQITPTYLELHFLDTGLVGQTEVNSKILDKTAGKIKSAAKGIRKRDYTPRPEYLNCRYCAYSNICPASAA